MRGRTVSNTASREWRVESRENARPTLHSPLSTLYSPRRAFTLVELLVVIVILLVLATMVFAVFRTGSGSDRMRSGARIVQSALLGAKDRALHAKDLRGVRLTRDLQNSALVTGFVYLQPLPVQTAQGITIKFDPNNNNQPTDLVLPASTGPSWYAEDQAGIWPYQSVQVRIPSNTGTWYQLSRHQSNGSPFWVFPDNNSPPLYHVTLGSPFQGGQAAGSVDAVDPTNTASLASCDVQIGPDVMPFHQPIQMTASTVIDLFASSPNVQGLAGLGTGFTPYIDIMFSPRGMVSGPTGARGPLHFFLRDLQDAGIPSVYLKVNGQSPPTQISSAYIVGPVPGAVTSTGTAAPLARDPNVGDRLIVTLNPQTGLVETFEMDPTDLVDLTTGSTGTGDGIADNPFNFAQQGKSAGR